MWCLVTGLLLSKFSYVGCQYSIPFYGCIIFLYKYTTFCSSNDRLMVILGFHFLGHMVILCLTFWRTASCYISISSVWGLLFLHIFTNTSLLPILFITNILVCMKWCLTLDFIFISLMAIDIEHPFMCRMAICVSLWRNNYSGILPIVKWVRVLYIFWMQVLYQMFFYFFPLFVIPFTGNPSISFSIKV